MGEIWRRGEGDGRGMAVNERVKDDAGDDVEDRQEQRDHRTRG